MPLAFGSSSPPNLFQESWTHIPSRPSRRTQHVTIDETAEDAAEDTAEDTAEEPSEVTVEEPAEVTVEDAAMTSMNNAMLIRGQEEASDAEEKAKAEAELILNFALQEAEAEAVLGDTVIEEASGGLVEEAKVYQGADEVPWFEELQPAHQQEGLHSPQVDAEAAAIDGSWVPVAKDEDLGLALLPEEHHTRHRQWWANLDQASKDLDKTIFRDLSPTPIP